MDCLFCPPKYSCGACNKAVTWRHTYICEQWYHIYCQGIDQYMYELLNNSNLSWECAKCGMPNFVQMQRIQPDIMLIKV
jgi:hypothetical protein